MFDIPNFIYEILDTLHTAGYDAYVVGGAVRDMLLGKTPNDFDITTSCPPEITAKLFKKTVNTGIKHGTVTVVTESGNVEVTTYRRDLSYTNHRSPDNVDFVSELSEDLKRRDFTINAFALSKDGKLIDHFNGRYDLNNKIIRAVGEPKQRFNEDALRILRAFRFSARLDFEIEPLTLKAAFECSQLLSTISAERIFAELKQILLSDYPNRVEPLILNGGFAHLSVNTLKNLSLISALPKELPIRFFAFCLLCNANPQFLCKALKTDGDLLKYCTTMQELTNRNYVYDNRNIKRALNFAGEKVLKDFLLLPKANKEHNTSKIYDEIDRILSTHEPYMISQLKISGDDIIGLSVSGKNVGTVLDYLLENVLLHPDLNNREDLLKIAKRFIKEKFTM